MPAARAVCLRPGGGDGCGALQASPISPVVDDRSERAQRGQRGEQEGKEESCAPSEQGKQDGCI